MISRFIQRVILGNFFRIELSGVERTIAEESIQQKYTPSLGTAIIIGVLVSPAIIFLDNTVLISVLIPITMVAGTAWFAISLASIKKKFESFGLELTTTMFSSFTSSLFILCLLTTFSFFSPLLQPIVQWGNEHVWVQVLAALLGLLAIMKILWDLFVGSLKYDINDAMLTGQDEAAEKFFKKSLSLLHASAENLRAGKGLEVANYYIGVSFYEIFNFVHSAGILNGELDSLMKIALQLKHHPTMGQKTADEMSIRLIESFLGYCVHIEGEKSEKSFTNIQEEVSSLKTNKEPQNLTDTRLSIIFEEIAELIDAQGEALFKKR